VAVEEADYRLVGDKPKVTSRSSPNGSRYPRVIPLTAFVDYLPDEPEHLKGGAKRG